jgi:hypothetical protein
MATLHFWLILAAQYGLFIAIQKVDDDLWVRRRLREPAWSYASWGAAVYCEIKILSVLAWGWVSRFRYDASLARLFPARPNGAPAIAHRVVRGVLGILTGIALLFVFAVLLFALEYLLADVIGLPPYLPGRR